MSLTKDEPHVMLAIFMTVIVYFIMLFNNSEEMFLFPPDNPQSYKTLFLSELTE